jgi:hypothetical protein
VKKHISSSRRIRPAENDPERKSSPTGRDSFSSGFLTSWRGSLLRYEVKEGRGKRHKSKEECTFNDLVFAA